MTYADIFRTSLTELGDVGNCLMYNHINTMWGSLPLSFHYEKTDTEMKPLKRLLKKVMGFTYAGHVYGVATFDFDTDSSDKRNLIYGLLSEFQTAVDDNEYSTALDSFDSNIDLEKILVDSKSQGREGEVKFVVSGLIVGQFKSYSEFGKSLVGVGFKPKSNYLK